MNLPSRLTLAGVAWCLGIWGAVFQTNLKSTILSCGFGFDALGNPYADPCIVTNTFKIPLLGFFYPFAYLMILAGIYLAAFSFGMYYSDWRLRKVKRKVGPQWGSA